jgi:arylsulfatase A
MNQMKTKLIIWIITIIQNRSNPFFLFLSHNTIHNPLKERSATIGKYEKLERANEPENIPVLGAMIERLDNSCGKIFEKVSELGLDDSTIVIFFPDNGGEAKKAAQTPLKKGKGWLYEGGIRESLIIKWKNKIEPKIISTSLISSIDFLPTFLELADINNIPQNVDGKSFVPTLNNTSVEVHEQLFWHFPHYHSGPPSGAIRSGKWKLIEWYDKRLLSDKDHVYELYNLEKDLGEKNNLADSLKTKTEDLANELQKWREDVNAQIMVQNLNYTDNN